MNNYLIKNAKIVNRGTITEGFVMVRGGIIRAIGEGKPAVEQEIAEEVDARGRYLIPGVIDDQVHFREPGLTHKGEIATESKAAVDMPWLPTITSPTAPCSCLSLLLSETTGAGFMIMRLIMASAF